MKIGLIGFGSIGQRHYANLLRYSRQIVVFSKRSDLETSQVVGDWETFKEKGPYDVIFITNETFKHIPTLNKCFALKPRAIFMEKPLSHDTKGLATVSRLIRQQRVSLWVGYNFHFFKPFLYIKKVLESGALGKLYYVRASIGQDLRTWRKRDYRHNYSNSRHQGGGVVLDLVHDINYPAWLLGDTLIPAAAVVRKLSQLKIDTEDCAETVLLGKKSGVVVTVHQDYLRVPRKQAIEISGSSGSLEWDSISNTISIHTTTKVAHHTIISERNEMFVSELKFFIDQVQKKKFFTNIDEAIHDMNIISYVKKYGQK